MRIVVLYIAMTLDGMIVDLNDGISFLYPYGDLKWVIDRQDKRTNGIEQTRY